ncbi:MAG: spondin domain-containing protein, partial [Pseudomonadota bacterium]
MINKLPRWSLLAATVIGLGAASAAHASSLRITVENNQGAGGLSITPLYLGFHNGSFDAFDVGGTASTGVELIAETGIASTPGTAGTPIEGTTGVAQERLAADPNSFGAVIASQSGPPPIQPGESESILVDIDNALSS